MFVYYFSSADYCLVGRCVSRLVRIIDRSSMNRSLINQSYKRFNHLSFCQPVDRSHCQKARVFFCLSAFSSLFLGQHRFKYETKEPFFCFYAVYEDVNNLLKNSTKSLDDLLKNGTTTQQSSLQSKVKNQIKPFGAQEKVPQIPLGPNRLTAPPGASLPNQMTPNVTVPPRKSNLLINGEIKGLKILVVE